MHIAYISIYIYIYTLGIYMVVRHFSFLPALPSSNFFCDVSMTSTDVNKRFSLFFLYMYVMYTYIVYICLPCMFKKWICSIRYIIYIQSCYYIVLTSKVRMNCNYDNRKVCFSLNGKNLLNGKPYIYIHRVAFRYTLHIINSAQARIFK